MIRNKISANTELEQVLHQDGSTAMTHTSHEVMACTCLYGIMSQVESYFLVEEPKARAVKHYRTIFQAVAWKKSRVGFSSCGSFSYDQIPLFAHGTIAVNPVSQQIGIIGWQ